MALIGRGIYSIRQAARLTGVPADRIRRWTRGYTYRARGDRHYSPPVIAHGMEPEDDLIRIDFADLLEVRFLNVFRAAGVSMRAIRRAALNAQEILGKHHPFSSRTFKTDGRTVLASIVPHEGGDPVLLDLVKRQYAFEQVVQPYLYEGVEFDDFDRPERWWPLGAAAGVVIDPDRSFGAPIVAEGVPTLILAASHHAEGGDSEFVASMYRVDPQSVRDAVAFEHSLSA